MPDIRDGAWWRGAAIYELYVQSFADGNGDGLGDLARELVHVHGDTFAAADLLSRACGISYSEASAQVQQFEEQRIGPGHR